MIRTATLATALCLLGAAPQAAPSANPPTGVGPLTVTFSSIPPGGILYEWDFDFLGTFQADFSDAIAADVSYTYTAIGLYTARLIVTDDLGAQTTHDVAVAVAPASGPPAVDVSLASGFRPFDTGSASVEAVARFGTAVSLYEWDVENDGVVDQSGPALSSITWPTGDVADLTLRLRVSASDGLFTELLRPYRVRFESAPAQSGPPDPPVVTAFTATSAGATTDLLTTALNVRVGDLVTFSAAAGAGAIGELRQFRFDFDGKPGLPQQFDRVVPATQPFESASVTHHYDNPGTYLVALRVIDNENSATTRTRTVNVGVEPGVFKTWLFQPRDGQRVYGDAVTLRAKTFPTGQTASVTFKYRPDTGGAPPPPSDPSWTAIKTVAPPPFTFLSTRWDVTGLSPGVYDLAAVADRTLGGSAESLSNERIRVIVDPVAPEILETLATSLQQGIDPNRDETGGLSGDLLLEIPAGATNSYDQMRLTRRSTNPHPLEARLQGLSFVAGHFRKINFDGGLETLARPSRLTFYVDDADNDGLVDGQGFAKSTLKVYRFNPLLKAWQPLGDQVQQPQEDLVRASLDAVGDVGIAGELDTSRSPGGTSSDCGLLGLEALLAAWAVANFFRTRATNRANPGGSRC